MPLATHFLTGSILSLVLPLAVLIVVVVWYVVLVRRGFGRALRRPRASLKLGYAAVRPAKRRI